MLSAVEQAYLTRVNDFAQTQVGPAALDWSMGQAPKAQMFVDAATLGLTGLQVPEALGGQGFSFALKARVCEALAKVDFGFAMSVVNTHNAAARLAQTASARVRDYYLPLLLSGQISGCTALTEPGAGSDVAAITTRARKTADGWVLTGEKNWIVNGRHAGAAIVFAQCGDANDGSGIAAFLVDLRGPDVRRYPIESVFSQHSIGTGGFVLNDAAMPADHLLLPPGTAFKSILNEINGARAYVAAMCCGMLDAALEQTAAYGARRMTFGKPLSAHQSWRQTVAQAQTDLAAAQALATQAIHAIQTGEDAQRVAAEAKIFAVQTCQRHVPALLHAMGAEGLRPQYCHTRHLGAVQMAALTDGSTQMLHERVARLSLPQKSKD